MSSHESNLNPELSRLAHCVALLNELRQTFAVMDDDGERDRAWAYLSDRFGEFERSEVPAWEVIAEPEPRES